MNSTNLNRSLQTVRRPGMHPRLIAAASLLAFAGVCGSGAQPEQSQPVQQPAQAGDAPGSAGPLASDLNPHIDRRNLSQIMRRVADWQVSRLPAQPQTDWTYAALYPGLLAVPQEVAGDKYRQTVLQISRQLAFQPGPRVLHADDQAVGQAYLQLYSTYHDPAMLDPIRHRMEVEMTTPDDASKPIWWWCDALFMAPPVLADLASVTGDPKYVHYMDHEWDVTSALLYDNQQHLYSRDATFLNKHEPNGKKVFWARGNGWVLGGLARVIDRLPANSPMRRKYVARLRQMASAVAPLQGSDGLWRPGLLDADAYKLPEVSGSMFIAYALAYGVNHGLLPARRYRPIIQKAWAGAVSHIYADGRLGCIQPIGSAPGVFTETSSYVYGVGAFLLAGSEIYQTAD